MIHNFHIDKTRNTLSKVSHILQKMYENRRFHFKNFLFQKTSYHQQIISIRNLKTESVLLNSEKFWRWKCWNHNDDNRIVKKCLTKSPTNAHAKLENWISASQFWRRWRWIGWNRLLMDRPLIVCQVLLDLQTRSDFYHPGEVPTLEHRQNSDEDLKSVFRSRQ